MEKVRRQKIRDGESQKREDAGARKGGEVAEHCVFRMFCGSGWSKSRLAKAADVERAGQTEDENLHAVVARSDDFWKLRCRNLYLSVCICICPYLPTCFNLLYMYNINMNTHTHIYIYIYSAGLKIV